jgi:hypothetical protein
MGSEPIEGGHRNWTSPASSSRHVVALSLLFQLPFVDESKSLPSPLQDHEANFNPPTKAW